MIRIFLYILDPITARPGVRAGVRFAAVLLLALAILQGLLVGGHLSEGTRKGTAIAQLSSMLGLSAERIRIAGLTQKSALTVLNALGVEAGGSLIGFSVQDAERRLANIDWVASAKVRRVFPNQLEIEITERKPFAIWQRGGAYYLIDRTGAAMIADPRPYAGKLLLISGEGAQKAAQELVNQLESNPALKSRLVAASRIGERRWNLYFPNGVKAQLPETGVAEALARLAQLESSLGILDRGVSLIDLRLPDRIVVTPALPPAKAAPAEPGPG